MRRRLAVMMFLQYAALGVWGVTLPTFLMAPPHEGGLSLSGQQVGLLFATFAIAAMWAPFLVGLIADRFFASEKLYAILHLFASLALLLLFFATLHERQALRASWSELTEDPDMSTQLKRLADLMEIEDDVGPRQLFDRAVASFRGYFEEDNSSARIVDFTPSSRIFQIIWQTRGIDVALDNIYRLHEYRERVSKSFWSLLVIFLAYAACYMPSFTLSNAISFRNLPQSMRQYGHVRVFGTVGWMAAGILVGFYVDPVSPTVLWLGMIGSLCLGVYAFTLPRTPPAHSGKTLAELIGVPAIRMFTQRGFRVFVITSFATTMMLAFHNTYLNRYLVDLRVERAAAWQTVAQITEIVCILILPRLLARIGLKATLFLGLSASVIRFAIYSLGNVPLLIGVGIPLQGLCFGFYFVAAMLFIDKQAPSDLRASAQGLLAICTSGAGALAGNWFAGIAIDRYRGPSGVAWSTVWALPTIGSLVTSVFFGWRFREPDGRESL